MMAVEENCPYVQTVSWVCIPGPDFPRRGWCKFFQLTQVKPKNLNVDLDQKNLKPNDFTCQKVLGVIVGDNATQEKIWNISVQRKKFILYIKRIDTDVFISTYAQKQG